MVTAGAEAKGNWLSRKGFTMLLVGDIGGPWRALAIPQGVDADYSLSPPKTVRVW
jgi:hypothetical protein